VLAGLESCLTKRQTLEERKNGKGRNIVATREQKGERAIINIRRPDRCLQSGISWIESDRRAFE